MPWCCGAAAASAGGPSTPLLPEPPAPVDTFGPMIIRHTKTAMVVGSSSSSSSDAALLERLRLAGWQVQCVQPSQAAPTMEQLRPHLVLLDNKLPDLAAVSKSLHALPVCSDDVLFAAVSDRPLTDKRKRSLTHADVLHSLQWCQTDIALLEFFARLSNRQRVIPALFAVLDEADQAVEVCDDAQVVQYVNRAYESVTGCLRGEVIGQQGSDVRRKSLPRPRDGELDRRRSSDWRCIRVPGSSFNNQYVYMKRRSLDAAMYRDVSLKSLRSQQGLVEAPITEVLNLLRDASARVDGEPAQLLKDALKVLTSPELYTPSITRFRDSDRIATQYYDGLIRLHHPARQRKRSVVDAYRDKRGSHGTRRISADVKNALADDASWSFDVIQLERVSEHHPLLQLGLKVFERWKVCEVLGCNEDVMGRWLATIEAHYHSGNAYHNATHAADVLQATSFFLDTPAVAQHVNESHAVAALIAAAVHDIDHPGRGNAFLINTRQSLAILYNDTSVLENHHVALAFQLTLQQNSNVNIFSGLSRDEFSSMRAAIIEMVLATDIRRHFEYIEKFRMISSSAEESPPPGDEIAHSNSLIVCSMLVKCADISNPSRDFALCQKWAHRIVEEYFDQTREEQEKGLPVTMTFFDRDTCNVPVTQCGFIDMFAREAFSCFSEFADLPELIGNLESNYARWKSMTEQWTPEMNKSLSL